MGPRNIHSGCLKRRGAGAPSGTAPWQPSHRALKKGGRDQGRLGAARCHPAYTHIAGTKATHKPSQLDTSAQIWDKGHTKPTHNPSRPPFPSFIGGAIPRHRFGTKAARNPHTTLLSSPIGPLPRHTHTKGGGANVNRVPLPLLRSPQPHIGGGRASRSASRVCARWGGAGALSHGLRTLYRSRGDACAIVGVRISRKTMVSHVSR